MEGVPEPVVPSSASLQPMRAEPTAAAGMWAGERTETTQTADGTGGGGTAAAAGGGAGAAARQIAGGPPAVAVASEQGERGVLEPPAALAGAGQAAHASAIMPTARATGLSGATAIAALPGSSTAVAPAVVSAGARDGEGSNHHQKVQASHGFALGVTSAAAVCRADEGVPRVRVTPHGSLLGGGMYYYGVPRRLTKRLCVDLTLPSNYMSTYYPNVGHNAALQLHLTVPAAAASAAAAAAPARKLQSPVGYGPGVLIGAAAAGDGSRQSVVPGISSKTDRGSDVLAMVVVSEQDVRCTFSQDCNHIRVILRGLKKCLDPFLNWRLFYLTKVGQSIVLIACSFTNCRMICYVTLMDCAA